MTESKLHPSEYSNHWLSGFRSHVISLGGLALATTLTIVGTVNPNHRDRTILFSLALASLGISRLAVANQVDKQRIILDFSDISDASRQQRLYESMQPTAAGETVQPEPEVPFDPEVFNWPDFAAKGNQYPHLMILGQTGDGKTTLAEWIHQQMEGKRIALHPHWQAAGPGERADFEYCDEVIGGGRRFDAIATYLETLHDEMDRRSKLPKADLRACPQISVLVDELPAIAKNCGDSTIERLISLIFESRKFKIRLIVLAQADSVKILKLEGQGAVRENLTYVRLGTFSESHAKQLINKKLADYRLADWLSEHDHPAMVEDTPAVVPIITNGHAWQSDFSGPPTPPGGGNFSSYPSGGVTSELPLGVTSETQSGRLIQFPSQESYPLPKSANIALIQAIYAEAQKGNFSTEFIKESLGYKGKHYAGASKMLRDIFLGESNKNSA